MQQQREQWGNPFDNLTLPLPLDKDVPIGDAIGAAKFAAKVFFGIMGVFAVLFVLACIVALVAT